MLLFDLDGTITDSNGLWGVVDEKFLGRHGLEATEEYIYTVGHSIFPVAAQFTKDYFHLDMTPQEIMDEWMDLSRDAYRTVALKPGVAEFLAQCKASSQTMALLTAAVPELCRSALDAHGLGGYFKALIFAQELGMEKRNPQIYLQATAQLAVAPTDCLFFEDAPANCTAAKSVGIRVVGVYDNLYRKYEEEMRNTCDRYIMSFEELLN